MPYWAVYSASKAALLALSDALRMELAPWDIGVTVLTLGAFATDMRSRAQSAWSGDASDRYEPARLASRRLVAMLDSTAGDPGLVADAVIEVLGPHTPPAHRPVGGGIDDMLALATQPADVRAAVLGQLLAEPPGAGNSRLTVRAAHPPPSAGQRPDRPCCAAAPEDRCLPNA
jgi:NAD(P)-dependent dehydrogenase (short-subunit alcohol dehydrogenase family)